MPINLIIQIDSQYSLEMLSAVAETANLICQSIKINFQINMFLMKTVNILIRNKMNVQVLIQVNRNGSLLAMVTYLHH